MYADDFRRLEVDGLTEHACFGFDAAYAPTHDADTVNHGRVRVGTHESVGIKYAVLFENKFREVF